MTDGRRNGSYAVEIQDLRFGYGDQAVLALRHYTLDTGASAAVIGPSGSGKTTLVQLLAGLLTPDRGSIRILGQDLGALSESRRDRFRGRHIGFVFQQLHLMPALTVEQNLALARQLAGHPPDPDRLAALLEHLGLGALGGRRPRALSHGQAQRVAIARALVHAPELLIADEPTSALDDANAEAVLDLLVESAAAFGAALIVVTHDRRVRGRLARELSLERAA